jgi:hypothetical protein
MDWSVLGTTLVTLAAGAAIGLVPTLLVERRKERRETRSRWDASLYSLAVEFMSTAEECRHLSRSASHADQEERRQQLRQERRHLWMVFVQLRLVGDARVQRTARMIIRHSWAYNEVEEGRADPRRSEFGDRTPQERLTDEMYEFMRAVRMRLRVENAEEIATDEPSEWPEPFGRDVARGRPFNRRG